MVNQTSTANTPYNARAQGYRFARSEPERLAASRSTLNPSLPAAFRVFQLFNRGAQGRIRTSVARKERQIYSLLPLTARPPVPNFPEAAIRSRSPTLLPAPLRSFQRIRPRPENLRLIGASAPQWSYRRGQARRRKSYFRRSKLVAVFRPLNPEEWSWRRDLNPRPSDYKSDALPAELRQPMPPRKRVPESRRIRGHTTAPRKLRHRIQG